MSYQIRIKPSAEKEMRNFPPQLFRRIAAKIRELKENPKPFPNCRKLEKPLEGYRIRVGDYRVFYMIEEKTNTVFIFKVMHRKDVYSAR